MEHKTYKKGSFHNVLKKKADYFAYSVYKITRTFPKEELYGITSQLRRAALSIVLNYIEGYARIGTKEYVHFLRISYGSLKESKYLLFFSLRENFVSKTDYDELLKTADELGAMFWKTMKILNQEKTITV